VRPLPSGAWELAARAWRSQAGRSRVSSLQHEVCAVLWAGLGVPHEAEADAGAGLLRVDIAITPPGGRGPRVALEVDGPTHFLAGGAPGSAARAPRGATLLRNALLARLGWRLVVLPFSAWPPDFDSRVDELRALLGPVLAEARPRRPGVVTRKAES
jgi:hypothetical protein